MALSTKSTASASSIRRDTEVEIAEVKVGVWPNPSPSKSTSRGCWPSVHDGKNGPATRIPLTRGVRRRPNSGAQLLEKRDTILMKDSRSDVSHCHDTGHPCLPLFRSPT